VRRALALLALAACGGGPTTTPAAEPGPAGLAARLIADSERITGAIDPAAAAREIVAGWKLPEPAWRRRVTEPYRGLWREYAAAFDAEAPALAGRLEAWARDAADIDARVHYAGDPDLTLAQSRLRTALPTGEPGAVIVPAVGDVILGEVFVFDGGRWYALAGLDAAVRARVARTAPACAEDLARAGKLDRCGELGWEITRAALADDVAGLARACAAAAPACAVPAPR
jgi:hypothetical protein